MDATTKKEIAEVTKALMSLGPNIDPAEARLLAHEAVNYPKALANQYNLVQPAYLKIFWLIMATVKMDYAGNGLVTWRSIFKHVSGKASTSSTLQPTVVASMSIIRSSNGQRSGCTPRYAT